MPNVQSGSIVKMPESHPRTEDEEKVVAKKPYSAPTLVELGGDLTEAQFGNGNDSANSAF